MLPVSKAQIIGQPDQEFHDAAIEEGMAQFQTGVARHPVMRFARVRAVAGLEPDERFAYHQ